MSVADALYERDGHAFVGTGATKASWYDNGQAGGAVLALLGHVIEDVETRVPMSLSRLTVDIVRRVPLGERLYVETALLRDGKRIQVLDLTVRTEDSVTTHARALRIRDEDITAFGGIPQSTTDLVPAVHLPDPSEWESAEVLHGVADFLVHGAELRRSPEPINGQCAAWVRLRMPVVAGEAVRATSRAVLAFDIVNLLGVPPDVVRQVGIINPDVTGHLFRVPTCEWVALTGNSYYDRAIGHGMSMALISDADGVCGLTSTTQVVGLHSIK
jgi:hypothetical protein